MSFLAPIFLLGSLAVSLPIVFHLIRRTTRERTPFSSLIFLLPSPPRLTRRSRLEHILLLILRCTALCLLTLGFARPFFKKVVTPPQASAARRILLLVDTSASMRRANLWADARARAESILRETSAADQVAIFSFDRQMTPLLTFDQWNGAAPGERAALAERKLADISPGWSGTDLGKALIRAAEALADAGGKQTTGSSQIVLISDLQEGSHLEPLQGYEWPRGIELSVEALKPKHVNNASLQLVTDSDDTKPKASAGIRVRVSNAAEAKREQFKVGWAHAEGSAFASSSLDIYVPPGQSRIVSLPVVESSIPLNRILLQGDDEDFDNSAFVLPPETRKVKVLYFGNNSEDSKQPLYFLQRAFQETRRQDVQIIPHSTTRPIEAADSQAAWLYIVTDSVPDDLAQAIHRTAAGGKTVLFVPKDQSCGPALARLLGLEHVSLQEAHLSAYAMLGEIDFRHPLFASFADPRFSDFTKIHFWRYRRVEESAIPSARVIARFDGGDPALLEVPIGTGRVLVLTSGWQPDDSQLALSTKFVPLLYSLLEHSGVPEPPPTQYQIGDTLPLGAELSTGQANRTMLTPDGSRINLPAGEANFSQTILPGIYRAFSQDHPKESRFVVNLDATESRTTPVPLDELERLGAPVTRRVSPIGTEADKKVRLQNADLENRQKLWRWLILATLSVLLVETYFAGRTARQSLATHDTATT
jgi:hypothetical protein